MSFTLDDRVKLSAAFYRLTDTSSADTGLSEQDTETAEAVHFFIQHGLWDAQHFLIESGAGDLWVTTSATLTFSGSEATDAGRYVTLPTDFLRLVGDMDVSGLRSPNGTKFGQQIDWRDRHAHRGDYYYLMNGKLWITVGASPPSDLIMDYHQRHATLTADGTAIDFPLLDRPLIVAYAANNAKEDAWLAGGVNMEQKIERNLARWQKKAAQRARRTRQPRQFRAGRLSGSKWFV